MTSIAAPGGYSLAPTAVPRLAHTRHGKLLGFLTAGLLAVGGLVAGVSAWVTPAPRTYTCPPDCGHPPTATPVSSSPLFTGAGGAYTVRYEASDSIVSSTTDADGVTEKLLVADGGVVRLSSRAAKGRTAQQVATDLIRQTFPDARAAYQVPNAMVGFALGYGEVLDVYTQSSNGSAARSRLVVMVAVKNDLALIGEALGPYHPATPGGSTDDGHATGVSVQVAQLLDPLINSFAWRGDPPR